MGKLTVAGVRAAKSPGRYVDGDGLCLVVKPGRKPGVIGPRSWVLRIQSGGRRRDFGLGSVDTVSLAEAREEATRIRKLCRAGIDPLEEKKQRLAPAPPTFIEAAELVHGELKPSWREGKHRDDWLSSLKRHAYPKLGKIAVDKIDGPMIRDTLLPIWLDKPETARRVRQRIGLVIDWAHSNGFRDTEAPLRSVTKGLPRQPTRKNHFAAMPYADVPDFLAGLRDEDETVGRRALEFTILTAARSGEVRGAKWSEFDLEAGSWTVPAERMKTHDTHKVPLSPRALAIVKALHELRTCDYVFPGARKRPLSDMTLTKVLRDAKQPFTVHGFRSSFRDWAGEKTSFPGEVAEAALSHVVKNPTERAYHRTKYFDKRRKLMDAWARFCAGTSNIIRLAASA
jgi:integrase